MLCLSPSFICLSYLRFGCFLFLSAFCLPIFDCKKVFSNKVHSQPWINVPGQKLIILNIRNCAEETDNKQYLGYDHNKTDA